MDEVMSEPTAHQRFSLMLLERVRALESWCTEDSAGHRDTQEALHSIVHSVRNDMPREVAERLKHTLSERCAELLETLLDSCAAIVEAIYCACVLIFVFILFRLPPVVLLGGLLWHLCTPLIDYYHRVRHTWFT